MFRHKGQTVLFGVTHDGHTQICVLESDACGYVDMAVDDAWYDEFPAKIGGITIIGSKAGLVAHIDKLSVLYRKGRHQRVLPVRCKDFRVFNNLVCFHSFPPVTYLYV